jgi:hypothetical protein
MTSSEKAEVKLTDKKSKIKLFERYNKYSTGDNRDCRRKTSYKNEYSYGKSKSLWEADTSDSPEEND